ncbi:MAG: portal protein, partial [Gammaproteobacteria bacterium]|nr:portal protein [Gammaproteobacteria bacterium]
MADFYNRSDKEKRDLFDAPDGAKLSSNGLDLPTKLTLLLKRGFGQKFEAKPKRLDAPTKDKHVEYMKSQFAKATYDHYVRATTLEVDRRKSFEDYTVMDYTPEISSALDIYADESLTKDEYGVTLNIRTDNERIKKVLRNLFDDILDIDHNLWQWTRQMCKFGNHFLLLDVQPQKGVTGFLPVPTEEIRREEAYDGDINSIKFIWDSQNIVFDSWQLAHFRMLSDMAKFPYGTSSIESARLVWKQLQLAEDAMLIYRITRAPERRVFYIDVGNIDPGDVSQYITDMKNTIKRT